MDSLRNILVKNQIDSLIDSVTRACNDKSAHEEARELVPIARLVQDNVSILEDGDYHDNLLPIVTDWFKNEFFTWFTPPRCTDCNRVVDCQSSSRNIEGLSVEHYKCEEASCNFTYDFIRHNDPAILLKTRQGRCGEWANCFMLILRSLDFDTRIVHDSTDHVWNEVWSEPRQMYIHVDPCEGEVDNPLLYEIGWSKDLEYCIAYNHYDVMDVTPRYTKNFQVTLAMHRKSCDEPWLMRYLNTTTAILVSNAPKDLRAQIVYRRDKDITYILELANNPRQFRDMSRFRPRETGGIQWRIARGEYSAHLRPHNVIRIEISNQHCDTGQQGLERAHELYQLKYNSDRDIYYSSSDQSKTSKNWYSLIYESENIDHKYEPDWNTSYLARYDSCPYEDIGRIQWRLDITRLANVEWTKIKLFVKCQLYDDTSIDLQLLLSSGQVESEFEPICIALKLNEINVIERTQIDSKTQVIDLIAHLRGGIAGDTSAWQKPQLFRQTRGGGAEEHSLYLSIC